MSPGSSRMARAAAAAPSSRRPSPRDDEPLLFGRGERLDLERRDQPRHRPLEIGRSTGALPRWRTRPPTSSSSGHEPDQRGHQLRVVEVQRANEVGMADTGIEEPGRPAVDGGAERPPPRLPARLGDQPRPGDDDSRWRSIADRDADRAQHRAARRSAAGDLRARRRACRDRLPAMPREPWQRLAAAAQVAPGRARSRRRPPDDDPDHGAAAGHPPGAAAASPG